MSDDPSATDFLCSFCGTPRKECDVLISGPAVFICDKCVELCVEVIAKEREKTGAATSKGRKGKR